MTRQAQPAAEDLDRLCIDTLRFLAIDAVQKANSGHPGLPMGAAPMAYLLWTRCMKYNPKDPGWFDRDRFVLSAGHGSMLLYGLLHLTGFELSLDEIKRFRQWGSSTPGHPERGVAPGVEVSTGPLGQGFGNAVGMAIAEAHLAARYNRPGFPVIDHYSYVLASDGDLMEGVASEAASLAGHLKLGKLICLYDDNRVSLSASTDLCFTEDRGGRFRAYGWQVQTVEDGNDLQAIGEALEKARADREHPSLIMVRTHLGYGSPGKQDSFEAHGSPLGEEEVRRTKEHLGWPTEPAFLLPERALGHYREAVSRGAAARGEWDSLFQAYRQEHPEPAAELERVMAGELPAGWQEAIASYPADAKGMATRVAAGKVLSALAEKLPELIGGSADLDPSTRTMLKGLGDFGAPFPVHAEGAPPTQGLAGGGVSYAGRNLHFGIREHAMA
ncbi:transketolase, partial [Geomonas sp.]|uniref:transketolase family protein n=1 Tax=Geomonas sp. TaxID=2651584 RepID=UPI002B4A6551